MPGSSCRVPRRRGPAPRRHVSDLRHADVAVDVLVRADADRRCSVTTSTEFAEILSELDTHPIDAVEQFIERFVVYPSEHARVAHTLWIAHTWFMEQWDSTPRIAFLSPEPGSGKSRALEVTEPLVPRPVHAVNTTPAYLFRKVSDDAGPPTILFDEIDTVFGPKAKDNEEVRGMLNAGHRKGAVSGRCVVRGKTVETEELPAYCAVALAGLDDLPDTIMTRSVVVRMRRRSPTERVEPWRMRLNGPEGERIGEHLREWAADVHHLIEWPQMPEGIEDRNADVWEALLAIADLAGGDWPERARVAAVSLVTSSMGDRGSLGVTLLRDLRTVFEGAERLPTKTILERLTALEESPWSDLRGKELDARGLSRRLLKYQVKPSVYRDGDATVRGYTLADLSDPFERYLPPLPLLPLGDVTAVTNATVEAQVPPVRVMPDRCSDGYAEVQHPMFCQCLEFER